MELSIKLDGRDHIYNIEKVNIFEEGGYHKLNEGRRDPKKCY
jgi:hypothetical protein